MQNENEIPNVNKEFKLSQEAEAAQKTRDEQQRAARIELVKDDKERAKIERMAAVRDKEVARDTELKRQEQQKQIEDETQKRIDNQKNPSLDHPIYKSFLGKTPARIADEVRGELEAKHANELAGFQQGVESSWNKRIDKQIDKTLERQQEQERQEKAEQTFEKSAEQSPDSSRDAFTQAHDRTGGEKDWRTLREERQQGNLFDRKR